MSWFSSIAFVLGEQISRIEPRTLRTGAKNLKIQDGEDVDNSKFSCERLYGIAYTV